MAEPIKTENLLEFEILKNQTKEELEKFKLAKEIADFDDQKKFERKKMRSESTRLIIIASLSAFISLLSMGTTIWMKYLDKNSSQTDEVRKHIDNLKDKFYDVGNQEDKKNIACQIAAERNPHNDKDIAKDESDFEGICETLTQTVPMLQTAKDSINNINHAVIKDTLSKTGQSIINSSNKSDATLIALQNQKNSAVNEAQKQEYQNKIQQTSKAFFNSIPDSLSNFKSAVRLSDTIHNNLIRQIAATSTGNATSNQASAKDFGVSWFKTGYFLQYDNMRILLQYLDKQLGIQVQICQTTGSEVCNSDNSIVSKQWISYNSPLTVNVGGSKYQISLQSIDHAGNNPFKLAAYIDVVKLSQ